MTSLKLSQNCIDDRIAEVVLVVVFVCVNNDNFDGERTQIFLFDDEVGVFEWDIRDIHGGCGPSNVYIYTSQLPHKGCDPKRF